MKGIKFNLFILMCAILMVVSASVLNWTTYQTGLRDGLKEGEVYVQDGTEIYVADEEDYLVLGPNATDGEIKVGTKNGEDILLAEDSGEVFDLTNIGVTVSIGWETMTPTTQIIIAGDDGEICVLDWSTGKLEFEGKMSSSARSFFKYFLKPYVDGYIAGLSYEEARELEWEFPIAGRTFMFRNMIWPITQRLSIREFIEWLYDNDYKIVKEDK